MKITAGGTISMAAETTRLYNNSALGTPAPAQKTETGTGRRFDTVTLSGENSFEMELRGRLSQEIRTATTSGTIAALRDEIRSGTYQPDPMAIARSMLLWEEGS